MIRRKDKIKVKVAVVYSNRPVVLESNANHADNGSLVGPRLKIVQYDARVGTKTFAADGALQAGKVLVAGVAARSCEVWVEPQGATS
jgi:hypothetical protein